MSSPRRRGANEPKDRVRLEHMLLAAREAISFSHGKSLKDLEHDRLLVRALLHAILEIGEAAANVSPMSRASVPGVPWDEIVRMRNVLIHVYWGVRIDKLWATIERDLPPLIEQIERGLLSWPSEFETGLKPEGAGRTVVGADGAKAGAWIAFRVRGDVFEPRAYANSKELFEDCRDAELVLLDVPIGLPDGSGEAFRSCDSDAQRFIGARRSSVFAAPARWMLDCHTKEQADREKARRTGSTKKVSRQVFVGMVPRIREVDQLMRSGSNTARVVRECHPEVCFRALAMRELAHPKKEPAGLRERRSILTPYVAGLPLLEQQALAVAQARGIKVQADDILDAFVATVTAAAPPARLRTLPASPPRDSEGLAMEMVYRLID